MVNKSSLLAIKALAELALLPPGQCEGVASIARRIDAPANYLGKLLQSLVPRKLVVSKKGKGGGFQLNKSPKKISLFDIVECIEEGDRRSECFLGYKQCMNASPCCVHDQWKLVCETNINFLKKLTLYDLNQ